jgi:glycerophosphoryl diester phosphodiesterase
MTWATFHEERQNMGRPFVIAHRGVPKEKPENTLASFASAIEQGADALETDLRFTADGEIVLFHDETVERTTDGQGPVSAHTLTGIKRLRTRKPADNQPIDEPVPTLIDLLSMTQAQVPLLLELKDPSFTDLRRAERLIQTLQVYDMLEKSAIVSFKAELIAAVKTVCPTIPAGYITISDPLPPENVELVGPYWPLLFINPLYVRMAHNKNDIVAPLDTDPIPRLSYYLWLGVDALLADEPGQVIRALEQRSRP